MINKPEDENNINEALAKKLELEKFAEDNCILRVVAGSHAYGTNLPTSDWDERGIFINKMSDVILNFDRLEQVELSRDDIVLFELTKYMNLLSEQNPNILELIWADPQDILHKTEAGQILIDNRSSFLTSNVYNTYVNYAMSQLKRIKGHNHWINKPQPEEAPQEKDFISVVMNMTENQQFNKRAPLSGHCAVALGNEMYALWDSEKIGHTGANWINRVGCISSIDKSQRTKFLQEHRNPDIIVKFNQEQYKISHTQWKNYWQWKNNRNEKRSELEEKFGYDTKHAMHLIRLLRTGKDILEHQIVPVKRTDAQFLLSIREGHFSYDEIVAQSNKLIEEIEVLYKKTSLPEQCNKEQLKEITLNIYKNHWGITTKQDFVKRPKP